MPHPSIHPGAGAARTSEGPEHWPLRERVEWLRSFRAGVAARRDELIDLCVEEVRKTRWEALTADILPLLTAIRWHEKRAARVLRDRRLPGSPWWMLGQSHRIAREPLGTVGVIATWNYPVQLLGVQITQALVAGNRVVVKPSERSARTQALLLGIATDAGLPEGRLRRVDATREAGATMLRDGRFDHVVFTGSTGVGREIARWGAETLTPTTLELSGRDSAFVLADADPRLAARSIWHAATTNAGQTCMAPRRALVDRRVYRAFLEAMAPLASGARARRLIDERAARRVFELARDATRAGGRPLSGVLEAPRGDLFVPAAIADCPEHAALVGGDHFGPAIALVAVEDIEHALRVHAQCDQHLATSVFTRDARAARALARRLDATTVTHNDCVIPTGHPASSISGRGASGWGESRGVSGLLSLTRPVHLSTTPRLRPALDEPPPGQRRQFDAVLSRLYGPKRARGSPPSQTGPDASGAAQASINTPGQGFGPNAYRPVPADARV